MTLLLDVWPRRKIDFQDNIPTSVMIPSTNWPKKKSGATVPTFFDS